MPCSSLIALLAHAQTRDTKRQPHLCCFIFQFLIIQDRIAWPNRHYLLRLFLKTTEYKNCHDDAPLLGQRQVWDPSRNGVLCTCTPHRHPRTRSCIAVMTGLRNSLSCGKETSNRHWGHTQPQSRRAKSHSSISRIANKKTRK